MTMRLRAMRLAALLVLLTACDPPPLIRDGGELCMSDRACDDGYFCNGAERCSPGIVGTDSFGCVPGTPPCEGACDEARACVSCEPSDADGDGENATGCGGRDCDDTNARVSSTASEICDGLDQDCDRAIDESLPDVVYLDRDEDGHGDSAHPLPACGASLPTAFLGDDCDDAVATTHPGADELCNGIDDDCSRVSDDDTPTCLLADATAICVAARCEITGCDAGFSDCNGVADDGCEANLSFDSAHCGACDRPCEGTTSCVAGRCEESVCLAGEHLCGGVCSSYFDVNACGVECTRCPPTPHGTPYCNGRCAVDCDDGFWWTGDGTCLWGGVVTSLVPSVGVLSVPFDADRTVYSVAVPLSIDTLSMTAVFDPPIDAAISLISSAGTTPLTSGVPSPPIALSRGFNVLEVEVGPYRPHYRIYAMRGIPEGTPLRSASAEESDRMGESVAIDGDTLVVSAPGVIVGTDATGRTLRGAAYVLGWDGTAWQPRARLEAPTPHHSGASGMRVSIDGDLIAIGVPTAEVAGHTTVGQVHIYRRSAANWGLEGILEPEDRDDNAQFGAAIALEGEVLVVGAPGDDSGVAGDPLGDSRYGAGAVSVYRRVAGTWTREAFLQASDIDYSDRFGSSLALDGELLAVGVPGDDSGGPLGDESRNDAGAVYLFEGPSWTFARYLKASAPAAQAYFGESVACTPSFFAVGAPGTSESYDFESAGAVHLFSRTFTELRTLVAPNAGRYDRFGQQLAAEGTSLVVVAPAERGSSHDPSDDTGTAGAAYLFDDVAASEIDYLHPTPRGPEIGINGGGVAITREQIFVGAPSDSWMDPLTGAGGLAAGAVYRYPR